MASGPAFRRTIWLVALGILALATAQGLWALAIGSAQLLKDAVDWVYDVALYAIAAFVFGRGATAERACALAIGAILAAAGIQTLYDLWDKAANPRPIEVLTIGFSAASAATVGYVVLVALWRFRRDGNPLIRATWISARNAAVATTVFSLATFLTRTATSRWPEYALDLFGAALLFQGAGAIALATWRDRRTAPP